MASGSEYDGQTSLPSGLFHCPQYIYFGIHQRFKKRISTGSFVAHDRYPGAVHIYERRCLSAVSAGMHHPDSGVAERVVWMERKGHLGTVFR